MRDQEENFVLGFLMLQSKVWGLAMLTSVIWYVVTLDGRIKKNPKVVAKKSVFFSFFKHR